MRPLLCAWLSTLLFSSSILASQDGGYDPLIEARHFSNSSTVTSALTETLSSSSSYQITPPPTLPLPLPPPASASPTRETIPPYRPPPCRTCSDDEKTDTDKDTPTLLCTGKWSNNTACATARGTSYLSTTTLQSSSFKGNCSGSITYLNSIPNIVTSTFTETNTTVTLSGTETAYTAPPISYPPPFCEVFVVAATEICFPDPCPTFSSAFSFQPFTSTVVLTTLSPAVTKKTPANPDGPTSLPPSFGGSKGNGGGGAAQTQGGGGGGPTGKPGGNSGGGGSSKVGGNSNGGNSGKPNGGGNPANPGGNSNSGGSNSGPSGLGAIIASIFNNPFVAPKPTPVPGSPGVVPPGEAAPSPGKAVVTNINGIPVLVGPGGVVIGNQVFGPASTPIAATVNGQVFTVGPSQVVAPGATLPLPVPAVITAEPAIASKTMTVGGMVLTIGQEQVVINGQTFSIGPGAAPITTTMNGKVVTIGPSGVILPSTTVFPEGTSITTGPTLRKTTVGGLVFSVDSTEAIFSGTTFKIGPGATARTTVIGGKTISMGPSGIGLATKTTNSKATTTATRTAGANGTGTSSPSGAAQKHLSSNFGNLMAVALGSLFWL